MPTIRSVVVHVSSFPPARKPEADVHWAWEPGRCGSSRHGFTLVELLVVIAIIGTLIGLLLPAVQNARESARRSACGNNLKQLGLAMYNHVDARGRFPYGWGNGYLTTTSGTVHDRDCWFQRILPYIEQQSLSDRYEANTTSTVNNISSTIINTTVSSMFCSSDPSSPTTGGSGGNGFQGNYLVSAGACTTAAQTSWGSAEDGRNYNRQWGMFGYQENPNRTGTYGTGLRPSLCTDGLSKTLLASETIIRGRAGSSWDAGGYWGSSNFGGVSFITFDPPNTSVADRNHTCKSETWPQAPCTSAGGGSPARFWNYARSRHSGGVNVALCDAAVRFVTDVVDPTVWRNLGNRRDGNSVSDY